MRMKIAFFVLFAMALQASAYASPTINSIYVLPSQSAWMGEPITLNVNCTGDGTYQPQSVNVSVVGSDGYTIPRSLINLGSGMFTTTLEPFLFNKPNSFSAYLTCTDTNASENSSSFFNLFTVSNFTSRIQATGPSSIYVGDTDPIEIDMSVLRNNSPVTDSASFTITFNGATQVQSQAPYDPIRGWVLFITRPTSSGTYPIQITSTYGRASDTRSTSLTVQDPIQFSIASISNTWVNPNDTITLQLQASDRGTPIQISTSNLAVYVGSVQASLMSVTQVGNYFNALIQMPNSLPPNSYSITATLAYQGNSYSSSSTIYYIVPISGIIEDSNGNGITTELRFISGGVDKLKLYTDSKGQYSGSIPTGTYDLEATFPQSKLYLTSVSVNSFNDPIKYYYTEDDVVPGIRDAGLFSYEMDLPYYEANMEMKYDEKKVIDENNLAVFQCTSWNPGREVCNNYWSEAGGTFDTVRNVVDLNSSSLSAFVIGERKAITVNYGMDSDSYYISSAMSIKGVAKDSDGNPVVNATVNAYIRGTAISASAYSDSNGVFSMSLTSPDQEGNYTMYLSAQEYPYVSFNGSESFEDIKSRTVEVGTPSTLTLRQGQNFAQEFSVVNTGQADLLNLSVSLTGIPSSYFNMTNLIGRLGKNEENKIYAYFSIPDDADKQTYGATFTVSNGEINQSKTFGFTVVDKNQTVTEAPAAPSGKFILPSVDSNMVYVVVFAVVCFASAIVLKKIKIRKSKRSDIAGFLSSAKEGLTSKQMMSQKSSDYKNLITSQFPNSKSKDDYGKNN